MKKILKIGCSGWHYKEWEGLFYPQKLTPQNYFSYYAKNFNTVEINNTFYRFPSLKTVLSWYQQAPDNFKYSLKVSSYITHLKRFKEIHDSLQRFYGLSDLLQEKMGCFLFQFPKNFLFSDDHLERLVVALNPAYENVLEFRHVSWWSPKVFEALTSINALFCTVSAFDLPEDLIVINERAYIRFHGQLLHNYCYSPTDLSSWQRKIQNSALKSFWAYFNNDRKAYAPKNALCLSEMMLKK